MGYCIIMWTWILANKSILTKVGKWAGILLVAYQLHSYVYDKGVHETELKYQAMMVQQQQELHEEYEKQVQDALKLQADEYTMTINRLKQESDIETDTKVVTEYVDKIIEVPAECDSLMLDVGGLLKQSSDSVRKRTNSTNSSNK